MERYLRERLSQQEDDKDAASKEARLALADQRMKISDQRKALDYQRKLMLSILRAPSAMVEHKYAVQIRDIQRGLDVRGGKAVEEMRKRLRDRLPNATSPSEIAFIEKELGVVSLLDMENDELEALADKIADLRRTGRDEYAKKTLKEREFLRAERDRAVAALTGSARLEKRRAVGSVEEKKGRTTGKIKRIAFGTHRPPRIARMLDDGADNGVFHKWLVTNLNDAEDALIVNTNKRLEAGEAFMTKLGIKARDLGRTISFAGKTYTTDDVLSIFIARQNADSSEAITHGNVISEEEQVGLTGQLDDRMRAWGNWLIEKGFEQRDYDRMVDAVVELENRVPPEVDRYFPMLRDVPSLSVQEDSVQEILRGAGMQRIGVDKGHTKERLHDISQQAQTPIRMGATAVWRSSVPTQERLIHYGKLINRLKRIFLSKEVVGALTSTHGSSAPKWLSGFIEAITLPDIYAAMPDASKIARNLRRNYGVAVLGLNALTMLKQLPSLALYMGDSGPARLMLSASQFLSNPRKMINFMREKVPQLKDRTLNRFDEELRRQGGGAYTRLVKAVGKVGMAPLHWFDTAAVTIGSYSVYRSSLAQGLSEKESTNKARESTNNSQPSSRAKDLAAMARSDEFMNWVLMFTNQLNQLWNMMSADIPHHLRKHEFKKAMMKTTAVAINAIVIGMISRRRPQVDEEGISWEELVKDVGLGVLSTVPAIGPMARTALELPWAGAGTIDPLPAVGDLAIMMQRLGLMLDPESDNSDEQVMASVAAALNSFMIAGGLPQVATKRLYRTFFEDSFFRNPRDQLAPWELIGGGPEE
jgi:hypothetical protein